MKSIAIDSLVFRPGVIQYDDHATASFHAYLGGKMIGFCDIYPLPTGELGIAQITIKRAYRRRGIATALFHAAQKEHPNLVAHSYDYTRAGVAWIESLNTHKGTKHT